jgi:hypothetical protein
MQLSVMFFNINYIINIKRSHAKLVIEICEEVLQQRYRLYGTPPVPCASYGIFLTGVQVPSYDLIPDTGILSEMQVEMWGVDRDHWYQMLYICPCQFCQQMLTETSDHYRMMDLFWVDEVKVQKFAYDAIAFRKRRCQKILDSCKEWIEARQKNWPEAKKVLADETVKMYKDAYQNNEIFAFMIDRDPIEVAKLQEISNSSFDDWYDARMKK